MYCRTCIGFHSTIYRCFCLCLFPTQRPCKTRQNPDSCFQCHFTLYNHKGFLATCCQCPAENRSAHHSSYYSLSPGTAWGYNIPPDRKRSGEREGMRWGRERKKDSSKTRGDKRDRERREVVTVRGRGRGEDVKVTERKGRGLSSQRYRRQFVSYIYIAHNASFRPHGYCLEIPELLW